MSYARPGSYVSLTHANLTARGATFGSAVTRTTTAARVHADGCLLQATDVVKEFGPVKVLRRASIALRRGEVHALLGENGSGKSTLAKVLCGVYPRDAGEVFLNGKACSPTSPADASRAGIAMVYQELSLATQLSVADNLFLGRERRLMKIGVDFASQRAACTAALAEVGLDIDGRCAVSSLSMAQKQLLEIAKALLQRPKVLILDEPTASLAEAESAHLFKLIERLKATDIAILYVTHHLREVLRVGDRISLIRDGQIVASQPVTPDTTEEELVGMLTGGRSEPHRRSSGGVERTEPLLSLEDVRTPSCRSISMQVFRGEVVGIYGVMGCGRDEVLRTVAGLMASRGGVMRLKGFRYAPSSPRAALASSVAYLNGDRKEGGILPNLSVRENYTLSSVRRIARAGFINAAAERALTWSGLQRLRVAFDDMEQHMALLSGGNQQKILFGRASETKPDLLILEDATAGIDVGARRDLYRHIEDATAAGSAFIWASSDIVETLSICDRVYAMHGGRIVAELLHPRLEDESKLMSHVLGASHEALYG